MKKLSELFKDYPLDFDLEIKGIKTSSKEVEEGDLFLCIKGLNVDRHDYIDDAIKRGAKALVVSKDVNVDIPYIKVDDTNAIVDELYRRFYDNPQDELKIIGITGTDGKTSSATIIQTLIGADICGYIGTNGYSCAKFRKDTNNTTPDKDKLYGYFREFVDAGCKYVAMEASSEAFFYHRLDNITFEIGAISNITSEHLNTHKTLDNYIDCKKELFRKIKDGGYSILNKDDKHFVDLLDVAKKPLTYGRTKDNDLYIKKEKFYPNKTLLNLIYKGKEYEIESPLLGAFNSENLALAILTSLALGFKMSDIIKKISDINISGRMDIVDEGQNFYCLVDYAHTPNGISKLLEFTKSLKVKRSIVVIGQAGERDPYKRKDVGRIVADYADLAIFTYEDPRNEDLDNIFKMMTEDILDKDNFIIIKDRHEAIEYAINQANRDDMVMILGKGNETYQKIGNEKIYFNDIEEAKKAIKKRLNR